MSFSSGSIQVDERKLYQIVHFILNEAESHELDLIRAALRKREGKGLAQDSPDFGKNIGRMMQDMARKVSGQIGASEEQIRNTVRGFAKDIIKREAPELREVQVEELLDKWVPDRQRARRKTGEAATDAESRPGGPPDQTAGRRGAGKTGKALPHDLLLTMVRQFAAYSTGKMTVAEETELSATMLDWQNRYWEQFSGVIRKLVGLYVKGIVTERDFWDGIYDELGLDSTGSPSNA